MLLECPRCAAGYEFPVELLARDGVRVRCTACTAHFVVDRTGVRPPPPPPLAPALTPFDPDSPADETCYLVVRGRARREAARPTPARPRRLARVPGAAGGPAPPRRIIAHRARLAAPPAALPQSATPEAAVTGAPPVARWRPGPLAAAGALAVAGIVAAAVLLSRSSPTPALPARELARPTAAATAPAERAVPGAVTARIVNILPLPDRRAVVVQGQILNGTEAALDPLRVQLTLLIEGRPKRMRTVWCCDDLDLAEAAAVANAPGHLHYSPDRDAATLSRVVAGGIQDFTVVFPSVPDDLLEAELDGRVELLPASGANSSFRADKHFSR